MQMQIHSDQRRDTCLDGTGFNFTCHPHVYPQMEWAILHGFRKHSPDGVARARWRTSESAYVLRIYRPRKDERLSWPEWLVTYRNKVPPLGVESRNVTHPSTNRARRTVTLLIRPTPPPHYSNILWPWTLTRDLDFVTSPTYYQDDFCLWHAGAKCQIV